MIKVCKKEIFLNLFLKRIKRNLKLVRFFFFYKLIVFFIDVYF